MAPLHVLILAAGEGKRMRSELPKLLHQCAGAPIIEHVVRAARGLDADSIHVVVAAADEATPAALEGYAVEFARQPGATGTADAVAAGCERLEATVGSVLVVNGDCPGVKTSTLALVAAQRGEAAAAVLTVTPADPSGYGRILRDEDGNLLGVVEQADATEAELSGGEVNGGVYSFDLARLREALELLGTDNAQAERYLTQVIEVLRERGGRVRAVRYDDADEVDGVNTRAELSRAAARINRRTLERLMAEGVTVRDPASTFIDLDVRVGVDTVLYPGVILEGTTTIGAGCAVHARVRVTDSRIDDDVTVLDGSVIENSVVEAGASIGPYGRLRPGSEIGLGAKIGNFVETKATRLGAGSKASHLTYLGNARIGENVNIGAGTITCNYDGSAKHETIIGDGAFIGSNTALVAPVRIGAGAYVGAGSTITEDVPDLALGLGRGRQINKEDWASRDTSRGTPDGGDQNGGDQNGGDQNGGDPGDNSG